MERVPFLNEAPIHFVKWFASDPGGWADPLLLMAGLPGKVFLHVASWSVHLLCKVVSLVTYPSAVKYLFVLPWMSLHDLARFEGPANEQDMDDPFPTYEQLVAKWRLTITRSFSSQYNRQPAILLFVGPPPKKRRRILLLVSL